MEMFPPGFVGPIPPVGPTSSEKPSEGTWRNGYPKLMGVSFQKGICWLHMWLCYFYVNFWGIYIS